MAHIATLKNSHDPQTQARQMIHEMEGQQHGEPQWKQKSHALVWSACIQPTTLTFPKNTRYKPHLESSQGWLKDPRIQALTCVTVTTSRTVLRWQTRSPPQTQERQTEKRHGSHHGSCVLSTQDRWRPRPKVAMRDGAVGWGEAKVCPKSWGLT